MGVLSDLGFDRDDERRGMLIDPPDHVLAEAGALKPRPTIASSLQTAEPAMLVAWWPERGRLDEASVSRLHWMVSAAQGEAWLVFDPDDEDTVTGEEIRQAISDSAFQQEGELALSSGEVAVQVRAAGVQPISNS
jgi:hypothetical protein